MLASNACCSHTHTHTVCCIAVYRPAADPHIQTNPVRQETEDQQPRMVLHVTLYLEQNCTSQPLQVAFLNGLSELVVLRACLQHIALNLALSPAIAAWRVYKPH